MWLFNHIRLNRRVSELEEALGKLKTRLDEADLDWDNLYDQCRKLMGRVAKERARMENLAGSQETAVATEAAEPGGNGRTPTGGMLTPHQRQIQQQILRRRVGGA